ncbi:MAG: bifunctional nuclease family protein [Ignavibacteria bacterium]|nr:bifunctional nuclease family protein [Ignavibacteria bacterium]
MNKVQVDIFGLTDRGMSQGAFALILKESDGPRRMPIIIGVPEAQAIANELEGVHAQRPMTHDLLRNVIEALGGRLREVVIHSLKEGTFYASLIFDFSDLEVDARPSDAIAIAVRCGVPIFVAEEILDEAAVEQSEAALSEEEAEDAEEEEGSVIPPAKEEAEPVPLTYREKLEKELEDAIRAEDYEKAARLRDELNKVE